MMRAAVRSTAHLTAIGPQFLVDELDMAIAYCRDKLDFQEDFTYESFYASVSRHGFPIHLKCAPKTVSDRAHRKQHEHLDAYVAVTGVEGEERPWACKDFYVDDADGYILCFSEENP